jgi:site-specific DNA-methyltransferase (adenine-specific)
LWLNSPDLDAFSLFHQPRDTTRKITQDALRSTYTWVPLQSWDRTWTDEILYKKYGITKDESAFIDSMIRPMDGEDE